MTRFNSLLGPNKFPVPMRKELARKSSNLALDSEPTIHSGAPANKIPCIFPASREFGFRDEFAQDCAHGAGFGLTTRGIPSHHTYNWAKHRKLQERAHRRGGGLRRDRTMRRRRDGGIESLITRWRASRGRSRRGRDRGAAGDLRGRHRRTAWGVLSGRASMQKAEPLAGQAAYNRRNRCRNSGSSDVRPPLVSFYILTTAEDDSRLQARVRAINKRHKANGRFNVVLLGWGEIVRRATLHRAVADKHFGSLGGAPWSPLPATWFSASGKLELPEEDFKISVKELAQDFHDWPTGHFVFRQRETDDTLDQLHAFAGRDLTLQEREERIRLRDQLRQMMDREARMVKGVTSMLCEPTISSYLLKVWNGEEDLPITIRALIEDELDPNLAVVDPNAAEMRIISPRDREISRKVYYPRELNSEIISLSRKRAKRYGHAIMDDIGDLPVKVRAQFAIPALIRLILRQLEEGHKTIEDLRSAGQLEIASWKLQL
jgi:hypothetical protein